MASSSVLDLVHFMPAKMSYVDIGLLCFLLVCILYISALPKPIPGIPYSRESARNPLGSIPSMLRLQSETGATFVDYMIHMGQKLDSPIFQVFLGPYTTPHVVLADFRESQDILLRRKEFDRAVESMSSVFAGMIPDHHIHMKTDGTWKAHRKLIQDMLLPSVMSSVAGPMIYANTSELIKLWRLKAKIGGGRPFDAHKDVFQGALDAILGVTFGETFQHHAIKPKVEYLNSLDKDALARLGLNADRTNIDEPVDFPEGRKDHVIAAILDLADSLDGMPAAPFPMLRWAYLSRTSTVSRAIKTKKEFIERELDLAVKKQNATKETDPRASIKSCVDLVVRKEREMAEKEGREPQYLSPVMNDEVLTSM
jgi:hypothetical protein